MEHKGGHWLVPENALAHCSMPKSTSRAEAMLDSEKIKPIALAIIEFNQSEGDS